MAYPIVPAPYGLKPVNLIGGQVFAGATRLLPIQYNYGTNIFYGDFVALARGLVTRQAVTTAGGAAGMVGIFLGCTYTDPVSKQKRFSQYYPANTLAGDIQAYVTDDPDTVFKAAIVTANGGTTIGSAAISLIGQNLQGSDLAGNINTGDSSNGLIIPAATTSSAYVARVVGLVGDTAQSLGSATYSSISTATVTLSTALTSALPVGTDVASIAPNGQVIQSGSYVATAAAAGATTVVLNAAPSTAFASSSTLVFTQYPEVLIKINFGIHEYYTATAV
jgi:hypothetical protein